MHKDDAALLFSRLSKGDNVKIMKKLYTVGDMNFQELNDIMWLDDNELKEDLNELMDANLVIKKENLYSCNKDLVDNLMTFIQTPCGCNK